jgi:hypothetical protein
MSEGHAAKHVRLVDNDGETMLGALLPTEHELWDADRRRLTVLLDPARIKRGLAGNREVGYPLRAGTSFRLVVDEEFRDAHGMVLRACAERRYEVGGDERSSVDPDRWTLTVPPAHRVDPLGVAFGRPLDHGLLARCLHVVGPDGRVVDGTPTVGAEERSWMFAPRVAWTRGLHKLVVDPVLEDVAGNSVSRVFDRDLTLRQDEPRSARPATVAFHPTCQTRRDALGARIGAKSKVALSPAGGARRILFLIPNNRDPEQEIDDEQDPQSNRVCRDDRRHPGWRCPRCSPIERHGKRAD